MKKKLTSLFLMFIILGLAACNAERVQEQAIPSGGLTPPIINLPTPYYNTTVEYGKPDLITDNTEPLRAYIHFPVAGDVTDEIIVEWARGVHQSAYNEIAEIRKNDPKAKGEVNIQFDSYFVNGRYAGILENGIFMSSHLAHPRSIIRTFNIDTKNKILLANTDILDYSQSANILAVMHDRITEDHPEAANYLNEMNEKWLEHIAIGHDGIIVVLERSVFLPSHIGALKVTLPYNKLGSAFVLGAEPSPEP